MKSGVKISLLWLWLVWTSFPESHQFCMHWMNQFSGLRSPNSEMWAHFFLHLSNNYWVPTLYQSTLLGSGDINFKVLTHIKLKMECGGWRYYGKIHGLCVCSINKFLKQIENSFTILYILFQMRKQGNTCLQLYVRDST